MRKLVTIRIDPQVWRKARELGLNISRTCENFLKQEIQRLTTSNYKTKEAIRNYQHVLVRPPGFEPGSSAWQADVLDQARLRPPIFSKLLSYNHALKFFSLTHMPI